MVTGTRDLNTDPDCSGATNFLQQLKPDQHHGHEWEGGPHRLAVSTRGMSLRPKHAQKLGIPVGLGSNMGHTHQHRPMLHAVGPRTPPPKKKVLGSSPGPDVTIYPGGSTGHSDQYHHSCRAALGHQYGPRWGPRPQASLQPYMVTGTIDINTDQS